MLVSNVAKNAGPNGAPPAMAFGFGQAFIANVSHSYIVDDKNSNEEKNSRGITKQLLSILILLSSHLSPLSLLTVLVNRY